ncbi:5719_t:CDS:1, partial [Acaulospora morrowiae]
KEPWLMGKRPFEVDLFTAYGVYLDDIFKDFREGRYITRGRRHSTLFRVYSNGVSMKKENYMHPQRLLNL